MIQIKILFFNRWVGCHVGGTETEIKELASRLAKRGHRVDILTTKGEELKKYEDIVKVHYVSKNWREQSYVRPIKDDPWLIFYAFMFGFKSFIKLLFLWIRGVKYDVVSVHCTLEAFLMRIFRWLFRIPYVFIFEGYTNLEARVAKHANLQIAFSQGIIDECFNTYGYKPILIPIGVDGDKFNVDGEKIPLNRIYGEKTKVILSVSRLSPAKEILTLIQAANIVCKKDPELIFIIIGEGSEREKIEKMSDELNLQNKVFLLGRVSDKELPMYYRSADIFVSTHPANDQFWIVVLEAISSGLPVTWTTFSTDLEGVDNWGLSVPPRKPEVLAEKILQIAHDDVLRKDLINMGLTIIKKYDWHMLIVEYEKAYKSVIFR